MLLAAVGAAGEPPAALGQFIGGHIEQGADEKAYQRIDEGCH